MYNDKEVYELEKVKKVLKNELVYVVRAYTFINKNGDIINLMTRIPFKYKKATEPIKIKENSYPLSNVLSIVGRDIPVSKMDSDMSNKYYLKYSLDEFKKIMESASVNNL